MIPTLDVDEVTRRITSIFESDGLLQSVRIQGEILDFKRHTSGHVYFGLTGRESRISCVLFRSDAARIPKWPQKGDEVYAEGRVSVYAARGVYQLYARKLLPIGQGAKARAREELRARLEAEGLFEPRLKRPLPEYPLRAAVVTSPTGAAVRDIVKVSSARFPQCGLVIVPTQVQGAEAPRLIARALRRVRYIEGVDVVLLARGGGSRDDLNPFDEEDVVRAVRLCPVPVVTGLGHEIDTTLADLAADATAATPSAAAERAFPDKNTLKERVGTLKRSAANSVQKRLERLEAEVLQNRSAVVSLTVNRHCRKASSELASFEKDLQRSLRHSHSLWASRLEQHSHALDVLSPLKVLARGYASCVTREGDLLVSVGQIGRGDPFRVQLKDGDLDARVTEGKPVDRPKAGKDNHGA
ncbi:MAG: exodeoxyribonuclease VII large subunit [Thermovirgaceae bacterium]